MTKKLTILLFLSLLLIPLPAQSEGIPLQKDVLLSTPIFGPEDLPEEITFTLYDSQTATTPLGSQAFPRGQYSVDFEFSKSDGVSGGNVARVSAEFTKTLNLKDAEGESIQPKEIWAGIEVGGAEVGYRFKVSDETLVQLLLASDASIATYLTLVYEGDDNPITTIYKDLPISSLGVDGSQSSLSRYFSAVAARTSDDVIIGPLNVAGSDGQIQYNDGGSTQAGASQFYYDDTNHRVGIGTANPTSRLTVSGNIGLTPHTSVISFDMDSDGSGKEDGDWVFGPRTFGPQGDFAFWRHNDDANGALYFKYGGNVGIGTTTPTSRLTVSGNIGLTPHTSVISFDMDSDGSGKEDGDWVFGPRTFGPQGDFAFWRHNDDANGMLYFKYGGNVGIGTTVPGYRLAVNGTIGCKELTVTSAGWADFVFEDNYNLPSLSAVEQFINKKRHLPGIPTEAEVKEKGVSLGEMSGKFLQKIEELTLYLIELKKENDSLRDRLVLVENQLNRKPNWDLSGGEFDEN